MNPNITVGESEGIRYVKSHNTPITPGPGSYVPEQPASPTSHVGTFNKEERKIYEMTSLSPGPAYTPKFQGSNPPTATIGKSNRFINEKPDARPFYDNSKDKFHNTGSIEGTIGRAKRTVGDVKTISPGPIYNIKTSLKTTKTHTIPKAERFPQPEEEDSPGPIYFPSNAYRPSSSGVSFPHKERWVPPKDTLGPGPTTSSPDLKPVRYRESPKLSFFKSKREEPPKQLYGGDYNPKDVGRPVPPSHSFAPPDMLALMHNKHHSPNKRKRKSKDNALSNNDQNEENKDLNKSGRDTPQPQDHKEVRRSKTPSPRKQQKPKETEVWGAVSPGPAHYLNIYKLFDSQATSPSYSISGRLKNRDASPSPGPQKYEVSLSPLKNTPTPKFGTAPREVFQVREVSPGPIYNNEKWTTKTTIRHGVATQTTNYTAKAESRARAEREQKQQQQVRNQLAALQSDVLPCDDEFADYKLTVMDEVPTRKDRFLANVWYP